MKVRCYDYDIYSVDYLNAGGDDDDYMARVRDAINSLPLAEKRMFVMYTEFGTYSEVAKQLKCSVPTISKHIKKIRKKIIECI